MTDHAEEIAVREFCPYDEDAAPGAGCIKEKGHAGAHLVTPGEVDSDD